MLPSLGCNAYLSLRGLRFTVLAGCLNFIKTRCQTMFKSSIAWTKHRGYLAWSHWRAKQSNEIDLLTDPAGPVAQLHRPLGVRTILFDGRLSQPTNGMSHARNVACASEYQPSWVSFLTEPVLTRTHFMPQALRFRSCEIVGLKFHHVFGQDHLTSDPGRK